MLSQTQINNLVQTTIEAGLITIKYYNSAYKINTKNDHTPVTEADLAANAHIIEFLKKFHPDIAILSEENSSTENNQALKAKKLFIIDPIDGTEAFIEKRPEFTINIGLVENNNFSLGFVYVPRLDLMYYNDYENSYKIVDASKNGSKEILKKTHDKKITEPLKIATSHRPYEIDPVNADLSKTNIKVKEFIRPSSSYKFCLVAEKSADLYLRRAQMKIWDVAAAIAILNKANCPILDRQNQQINFDLLKSRTDLSVPIFNVFASENLITQI